MNLTKEQARTSSINHKKARVYFGIYGDTNLVLHHVDTSLKYNDIERYIQWNPEDLVVMTRGEHTQLHWTGYHHSEETKKKMSETRKGRPVSEETKKKLSEAAKHQKRYPASEETRQKMSESRKGKHWKLVDGRHVYY